MAIFFTRLIVCSFFAYECLCAKKAWEKTCYPEIVKAFWDFFVLVLKPIFFDIMLADLARFCWLLLVCCFSWGRLSNINFKMGRGVSSGGGQSSLGYLFGSNDSAKPVSAHAQPVQNPGPTVTGPPPKPTTVPSKPHDNASEVPAGVAGMHETTANNYFRADGQNCGNFITDRPSTKVHSAPGGGSSLGYLFGGNN